MAREIRSRELKELLASLPAPKPAPSRKAEPERPASGSLVQAISKVARRGDARGFFRHGRRGLEAQRGSARRRHHSAEGRGGCRVEASGGACRAPCREACSRAGLGSREGPRGEARSGGACRHPARQGGDARGCLGAVEVRAGAAAPAHRTGAGPPHRREPPQGRGEALPGRGADARRAARPQGAPGDHRRRPRRPRHRRHRQGRHPGEGRRAGHRPEARRGAASSGAWR